MRAPLTFGLSALTLLFFVQGLGALFSVLFAVTYDAIFPQPDALAALLLALPVACLFTPALPFSLWIERPRALALGVAGAAAGRILLAVPSFVAQYFGAVLTVAFGALFLAKAVGWLDRRNVGAALALALVTDALLRLAGSGYSLSDRPGWLPVQVALGLAAVGLAVLWLRDPRPEEEGDGARTLERRQGGLRLRGALAMSVLLFLELNVLGRPEVAARWTGASYGAAGIALTAVAALAIVLLLGAGKPVGRRRTVAMALTALAVLGAALADALPIGAGGRLAVFAVAHGAALLLFARALVPASGRRRGWTLAAGLGALLGLTVLYASTYFYAFTAPALQGRLDTLLIGAGVLLGALLAFIPRSLAEDAPLRRPLLAVPAAIALILVAVRVAPGEPTATAPAAANEVTVATYNVHYGYDERWRYDPERIARTIEASGADVVALQEVSAGLPTAHGTDLARWLGHRLGMEVRFAPATNGLLGGAVLTRLPVASFSFAPLPPARADAKTVAHARLLAPGAAADTISVLTTHLGLSEAERTAQLDGVLRVLPAGAPAIFLGDLNAEDGSAVANTLRAAGFADAFALAGAPPAPTWPTAAPRERIDWIWVRGYVATAALVSDGGGSDHRLVAASIRLAAGGP